MRDQIAEKGVREDRTDRIYQNIKDGEEKPYIRPFPGALHC